MTTYGRRIYRRYDGEEKVKLEAILHSIRNKHISLNKASKKYNIPKGTLSNKLNNLHTGKIGKPFVLPVNTENIIVQHILAVSEWGFPFTYSDLAHLVKQIIVRQCIEAPQLGENKLPSKKWCRRFIQRHKDDLTVRICQNLKRAKASLTPKIMSDYFSNLKELLSENGEPISANRIFNYDETNLSDDPGTKKCIFRRGVKYPERIRDFSKSSVSVMFCGSADGQMLPPYVVYKAESLWRTWTEGGPNQTRYNRSKSGWFDAIIFADWFCNHFIPFRKKLEGRVVLIGDNLSSHFSEEVLTTAERNNVTFCCLPKNSTHISQPLDVAFYGPLKRKWRIIIDSWKQSLRKKSQTVPKEVFPQLLKKLCEAAAPEGKSENLVAGFKKCGIFPWNPDAVLGRFPKESEETDENAPATSVVSDVVVNMLKEMRYGDQENSQRKKRTKINVEPGKSIRYEDLQVQDSGPSTSKCPAKKSMQKNNVAKKRKNTTNDSCSSETSDSSSDISFMDSSSEEMDLQELVRREQEVLCLNDPSSDESLAESPNIPSLKEANDNSIIDKSLKNTSLDQHQEVELLPAHRYIVAEFTYNKDTKRETKKHFVSEIIDKNGDKFKVSCLRRYGQHASTFIFPQVEDTTWINRGEIKSVLTNPKVSRGRYTFKEDLKCI